MIRSRDQYLAECEPITEEQYLQQFNPQSDMNLNLERPLVFIDLETTGTSVDKDRIVEIGIVKLNPDMSREQLHHRINPAPATIHPDAERTHGITWEMVKDCPPFRHLAHQIYDFIKDCDVAGYNCSKFDIPLLFKEFEFAGIFWDHRKFHIIDVLGIWQAKESRNLTSAYAHFCGKELKGAHGALADTTATLEIFLAQADKYTLPSKVPEIESASNFGKKPVDISGKFYRDEKGDIRFNFGKHRGTRAIDESGFLNWMLYKADFRHDTRVVCAQLLGLPEPAMLPHS